MQYVDGMVALALGHNGLIYDIAYMWMHSFFVLVFAVYKFIRASFSCGDVVDGNRCCVIVIIRCIL